MGKPPFKRRALSELQSHSRDSQEPNHFHSDWETFFSLWDDENPPSQNHTERPEAMVSIHSFVPEGSHTGSNNIPETPQECENLLLESSEHRQSVEQQVEITGPPHSLTAEKHNELDSNVEENDSNGNLVLVPESDHTTLNNPYSKEFYETGAIIIDKLRLKKHKLPSQRLGYFYKKRKFGQIRDTDL